LNEAVTPALTESSKPCQDSMLRWWTSDLDEPEAWRTLDMGRPATLVAPGVTWVLDEPGAVGDNNRDRVTPGGAAAASVL
jgi:hypothetical protein